MFAGAALGPAAEFHPAQSARDGALQLVRRPHEPGSQRFSSTRQANASSSTGRALPSPLSGLCGRPCTSTTARMSATPSSQRFALTTSSTGGRSTTSPPRHRRRSCSGRAGRRDLDQLPRLPGDGRARSAACRVSTGTRQHQRGAAAVPQRSVPSRRREPLWCRGGLLTQAGSVRAIRSGGAQASEVPQRVVAD